MEHSGFTQTDFPTATTNNNSRHTGDYRGLGDAVGSGFQAGVRLQRERYVCSIQTADSPSFQKVSVSGGG